MYENGFIRQASVLPASVRSRQSKRHKHTSRGPSQGTSCASPTAAAVFSLVNDMRLQAGKSPLGFLNPFIYANPKAFNDITTGSSDGCGLFGRGWPAAPGWDAVTGVGTPNYMKLAAAALQLA